MICAIATKTTGLKQGSHEVIELTIKPFALEEVTYRVRPTRLDIYDEKAQAMNGISAVVADGFPEKDSVAAMILSQWKEITPIGHYFKFDYDMIRNTFGDKFVIELFGRNKPIDTAILAETENVKRLERGQVNLFGSLSLPKICAILEIEADSKASRIEQVYKRLNNGI